MLPSGFLPGSFNLLMMVNVYALPKEIWRRILQEITTIEDLKSLRFVNRETSFLVTAQLFYTIFLRFQRDDLSRLIAISKDPILRDHVKEISYDIDAPIERYWNSHETTYISRPINWRERILHHRSALDCLLDEASRLAYAMSNLPNVIALRFVESSGRWHDLNPDNDTELSLSLENLPEYLRGRGVRASAAMLRAASITSTNITTFVISNRRHGLDYSFLNLDGPVMPYAVAVFANMTHISLYINTREGEPESQILLRTGILSELLATAIHLRHLSLEFDQRPRESVRLAHILGSRPWRDLRNLEIVAIDFHYHEMQDFLKQHQVLTHFKIANSQLYSGSLRQMFELLRNELQCLTTVELDGVLGDTNFEVSFLQFSENRRLGRNFILGSGPYPQFQVEQQGGH